MSLIGIGTLKTFMLITKVVWWHFLNFNPVVLPAVVRI